jgi:hypothetical protein
MIDYFGRTYKPGDTVYYVACTWNKHLEANHGKVVKVHKTTLTLQTKSGNVVLRAPQRHVILQESYVSH